MWKPGDNTLVPCRGQNKAKLTTAQLPSTAKDTGVHYSSRFPLLLIDDQGEICVWFRYTHCNGGAILAHTPSQNDPEVVSTGEYGPQNCKYGRDQLHGHVKYWEL